MVSRNTLRLKLPLFMTPKLKYPAGVVLFGVCGFMYYFTNHFLFFPARELPFLSIDRSIPFVPWTIFIYMSEYLFFTTVYLMVQNMDNLNKYFYSFFTTQALSCLIFFFFPTIFPRDLYPIPDDTHPVVGSVFHFLRNMDAATNCFPSLHVSTVYLSAYIFFDEQREKLPFFLIWGTLIAFSTLPTKQHYFVDIAAGFALSVVAYFTFHRWLPYRRTIALESAAYQANR